MSVSQLRPYQTLKPIDLAGRLDQVSPQTLAAAADLAHESEPAGGPSKLTRYRDWSLHT